MSDEKERTYYKFRCKARCGLSIMWGIGKIKDGKWKAMSAGKMKQGREPFPHSFAPYEIGAAVINGPRFDTADEAERYVRNL